MNKCHANINWVNDTVPAINDTNLNYMDGCIDTIDTRVVSLDTAKLEAEDVASTIKDMSLNTSTGVITCTRYDDSTFTIDTVLEKVVTNFTYDSSTQSLVLTLADGSTVSIPLSDFITETEFVDSATIGFTVTNHVVTAVVKANSIGDAQMQTGYLTDCQTAKNAAELAATTSNTNRLKSEGYAIGKHDGVDVPSTDEAYNNNSLYYSQESNAWANGKKGNTDVPSTAPQYHNNAKYWADQARAIVGGEDNVKYTSQSKTDAEKTIARTNIGAISGKFDEDDTTWTSSTDLDFEDGYYEVKGINANYPYEDYFPVEWCDAIDDRLSAIRTHLIVQSDYLQNKWLTLISQDLGHWQEHGDNLDNIRVWMMYYDGNQDYSDWQVVSNLSDGGGLIPHLRIMSETGATVTVSIGSTTITATETSSGVFECDVPTYGTYTIQSVWQGITSTETLVVDTVKIYDVYCTHFNAEIIVTYPDSIGTCTLSASGQPTQTATSSPYTFEVHEAGTYTITCSVDGQTKTETVAITTDGQSVSKTISFGTITVNFPDNMRSQTFTAVQSGTTITKTAPSTGNTFNFYPPTTGAWTVTGAYSQNVTVSNLSTSVSVTFITIKTFATATDTEIANMVAAADAGMLDLYDDCGWRVGQEHEVSLSAIAASGTYDGVTWSVEETQPSQTVTFVLLHKGTYELVSATASGRTTCSFIVGLKDLSYNAGKMNSSSSANTGWDGCPRRAWCNGGFRQSIPSSISSIFKQFKTKSIEKGGNNSTLVTSNDYFALAAEKEIYGQKNRGTDTEANALTQFEYYETSSNRLKSGAHGATSNRNTSWWGRTPHSNPTFAAYFINVGENGEETSYYPSDIYGLSPFGCI